MDNDSETTEQTPEQRTEKGDGNLPRMLPTVSSEIAGSGT